MTEQFSRVSPNSARSAFRAASRIVHPDAGGNARMQQQLNDAFNRSRR
jgi:hypothetical protein